MAGSLMQEEKEAQPFSFHTSVYVRVQLVWTTDRWRGPQPHKQQPETVKRILCIYMTLADSESL